LIAAIGAIAWLQAQTPPSTLGSLTADPAYVLVNTPTQVTFNIDLSSLSSTPTRVNLLTTDAAGNQILATAPLLHDDGLNGDAAAYDKVFSNSLTLKPSQTGPLYYRAAATLPGASTRKLSPVFHIDVWNTLAQSPLQYRISFPSTWTPDVNATDKTVRLDNYDIDNTLEILGPGEAFIEISSLSLADNEDFTSHLSPAEPIILSNGLQGWRGLRSDGFLSLYAGYDLYLPVDGMLFVVAGSYDGTSADALDSIKRIQLTFTPNR
jgi:hypothetical protein